MTPTQKHIAITTDTPSKAAEAQQLAASLGLDYVSISQGDVVQHYHYLLLLTADYLAVQKTGAQNTCPFYIDFLSQKLLYRTKQAGLRKELLARALGIKPSEKATLVDATAGLGRDSFILAALGFEVIMLERSPIIYALLNDALSRAHQDQAIAPIIERMRLLHVDAAIWLQEKHAQVDVIYLDPMFPERKKSASVKKEMVFLQELLGKSGNDEELLKQALACANSRVVVKRPRLAANLAERKPSFSLSGKSSRFDVYLTPRSKTD